VLLPLSSVPLSQTLVNKQNLHKIRIQEVPMNADPYPDSTPFFRKLHVTLSREKMRVYKYSKLEASYVLVYKFAVSK
jgi:hypothetical protein